MAGWERKAIDCGWRGVWWWTVVGRMCGCDCGSGLWWEGCAVVTVVVDCGGRDVWL